MAKVTYEDREKLKETIVPYQSKIKGYLAKEKTMLSTIRSDDVGNEYKKLQLAEDMITTASLYMAINALSVSMLDVKNNDALNDARKMLYRAVIYCEDVVTDYIDVSFAELSDKLEVIAKISIQNRYELMQKLGLAIQMLKEAFGYNSKWKWSFVELEGRFAAVAKNFIDMKNAVKDYFDPNSENYETTVMYMRMIARIVDASANGYRDKYEQSSRRLDDMKNAIKFLLARHKISVAMGDRNTAAEVKKKAVVWHDKMEADHKSGSSS